MPEKPKPNLDPGAKIKRSYQLNQRLVGILGAVSAQKRHAIEEIVGAAIHAFIEADDAQQDQIMKNYFRWVDSGADEIKRRRVSG